MEYTDSDCDNNNEDLKEKEDSENKNKNIFTVENLNEHFSFIDNRNKIRNRKYSNKKKIRKWKNAENKKENYINIVNYVQSMRIGWWRKF